MATRDVGIVPIKSNHFECASGQNVAEMENYILYVQSGKGEPMAVAKINVPIQVNLPDDWLEQIIDRLKNDPDAECVEITRCKDCKWRQGSECVMFADVRPFPNDFCSRAEKENR